MIEPDNTNRCETGHIGNELRQLGNEGLQEQAVIRSIEIRNLESKYQNAKVWSAEKLMPRTGVQLL